MSQIPFIEGDVLDAHDPPVRLELSNPVNQEKGVAMREDALDDAVVQRQGQRIHVEASIIRWPSGSALRVSQP
jgi:hypothetical protein